MPTTVLLVPARPGRGRALQRLTRLTQTAWRESGAAVQVLEPGVRPRTALRQSAAGADVVHLMDPQDAPLLPDDTGDARLVVHCHDLTDLIHDLGQGPERSHLPQPLRRRQARQVTCALSRADVILATSRHTAEQVSHLTGREALVLAPPIDPALTERPGRLDAWKPPSWPYLLTIGGSRREDRRDAAIAAWVQLRRTRRLDGASLVVVGPPLTDHEDALVMACGGHVTMLNDITDAQLGALYRHSRALLALGRPTGFVWPIAEAHQAGIPVLATDHPLFEETGQSGCVYLPVEGIGRFDAGTWACIADDLTSRIVADRGSVNAERFAWRQYADRLVAAAAPHHAVVLPEQVAAEMVAATPLLGRRLPEMISLPTAAPAPDDAPAAESVPVAANH